MGSSISYGTGTQAPDDCVDVGLQKSYDSLKSVPTHPPGPRNIDSDHNQAPQSPPVYGSGYNSGGNPLKQGGESGNA